MSGFDLLSAIMSGSSGPASATSVKGDKESRHADDISIFQGDNESKIIFIDSFDKKLNYWNQYVYDSGSCISQESATAFVKEIRKVPDNKTIDIIITTNGGSLFAAETIINSILQHKGKVRVHIPYYARSAGTLIALAADEIIMDKYAYIGPIDPVYGFGISSSNIIKSNIETSTSWMSDLIRMAKGEAETSLERVVALVKKIADGKGIHDPDLICQELANGKYNHDQPIFFSDIKEKGILKNVSSDLNKDILVILEGRKEILEAKKR